MIGFRLPINLGKVATPVFSPVNGSILSTDYVTITCATIGATIHYTVDGSTPTIFSTTYTAPINLPISNLVDPTKIKGVYNFNGGSSANTYGTAGVFTNNFYSYAGYSVGSYGTDKISTSSGSSSLGALMGSTVTSTTWSVLFQLKADTQTPPKLAAFTLLASIGSSANRCIFAPYSSTTFNLRVNGVDKGSFGTGATANNTPTYFAFILETDIGGGLGRAKLYQDGSLVTTVTFASEPNQSCAVFGVSGDNDSPSIWDNVFITTEIVSDAAIVACSLGGLPDSNGVLAGGTTPLKAIGTKPGYVDSDIASTTYSVT